MPTQTTDDQATHTFRAATIEEAVATAERTLGRRVTLIGANRIRRGGLGGFFAADLGVEVVVSPIEDTVESALERLIATSSSNDKANWEADRPDPAAAIAAALSAVVAADAAPVESPGRAWLRRRTAAADLTAEPSSWYSPPVSDQDRGNRPERLARMAELDRMFGVADLGDADGEPGAELAEQIDSDPTGRIELPVLLATADHVVAAGEPARRAPAPTVETSAPDAGRVRTAPSASSGSSSLARVERIIEELQLLTSAPRTMAMRPSPDHRVAATEPESAAPVGSRPAPGMVTTPTWPTATRTVDTPVKAEVDEAAPIGLLATPRALTVPTEAPAPTPVEPQVPAVAKSIVTASPELAQRQVELAVSAADALLGSLRREDGVKRLSVRVVLRTGDHDEVAAEAEWDASE